ncbi:hypothetical protein VCR3J2_80318 [Vibrio coralliirubri]|nr:hypothetical protein VCR3J2_80318 [Vibrio coralliirubri]
MRQETKQVADAGQAKGSWEKCYRELFANKRLTVSPGTF